MTDREGLINEILQLQQRIFQTMGQRAPDVWLDLGLTIDQLKSLLFIDFKGSTNFKSLAAALGVTPPNITGIVDRLVAQGLVSREENPEDRRMLLLKTTDEGKNLMARLRETGMNQAFTVLNRLSLDELNALFTGLRALVRVLAESRAEAPVEALNEEGET